MRYPIENYTTSELVEPAFLKLLRVIFGKVRQAKSQGYNFMLKKIWNFIKESAEMNSRVRTAKVLADMGLHEEARKVMLREN